MNRNTISLTSKGSAAARTYESQRADALFIDPFASIYARGTVDRSSENMDYVEGKVDASSGNESTNVSKTSLRTKVADLALRTASRFTLWPARLIGINAKQIFEDVAVRTRFLDDILQKNIMITNVKQIVLLACGGDFRPYRLSSLFSKPSFSSDLTFYLLDVPHVFTYRQKCLAQMDVPPTTPWSVVDLPCDLSRDDWSEKLCKAGFVIDQPTLWLAEGFFEYLSVLQIRSLFNQIRLLSSSRQTHIAFDLVSTHFQTSFRHAKTGGLFHFAVNDENEVHEIFSEMGCDEIECTSFQHLGAMYNRKVSSDRSFIVNAKVRPVKT